MRINFLGTNGWFNTHTGNTTCTFVETAAAYIILDAGGGLYKAFDLIKEHKPVYILLSHLHMDHIEGLQVMPLFKWKQGATIIVGDGHKKELENIMRLPYMPAPKDLNMPVEIVEVSAAKDLPFLLSTKRLEHIVPTIGYRIEAEGKVLTYALDTGVSENARELARDADILITECSYLPGQSPNNNHLNPEQAAQLALEANAKLLALIHFKADDYNTIEKRDKAIAAAGHIFAHTYAPYDGDEVII
ncbi:MAG: MBL fold metallo-hydrolase [Elusimicrobiota bacterium]|jgi:ribonuclease BN (tRNA processing enzyme)|nr:MBL fold metallo-hydrolase [Elusimicrobiota bacterium]